MWFLPANLQSTQNAAFKRDFLEVPGARELKVQKPSTMKRDVLQSTSHIYLIPPPLFLLSSSCGIAKDNHWKIQPEAFHFIRVSSGIENATRFVQCSARPQSHYDFPARCPLPYPLSHTEHALTPSTSTAPTVPRHWPGPRSNTQLVNAPRAGVSLGKENKMRTYVYGKWLW